MAVTQTGAMYKSLTFDNKTSREFGVYITGEAVYNAPERAVEMISIPGRNGAFALDQGRFENIEVSYPAGIFAETETDFAQAVSDFRNYLCSKKGYCRLTDEYNPSEYRMAVYKSGLEVDPAQLRAGEFTITFECKPQRWLTSGETATAVVSGGTVTNPTRFEASPLLEVDGYGVINIGQTSIEIIDQVIGEVVLTPGMSRSGIWGVTTLPTLDVSALNPGDTITLANISLNYTAALKDTSFTFTKWQYDSSTNMSSYNLSITTATSVALSYVPSAISFVYGTSATSSTATINVNMKYEKTGQSSSGTINFTFYATYDGDATITLHSTGGLASSDVNADKPLTVPAVTGLSTKSTLTNPVYIDLEVGEAYGYVGTSLVSVNNAVSMPATLPTIKAGTTTITYDNTITGLDVIPRWWKV